ncbi:MAG: hypothetical protein OEO79_16835 [Gemmatimonadota bacterium]|nr:hypothetical protein [Gemmatimonadota bacterium]
MKTSARSLIPALAALVVCCPAPVQSQAASASLSAAPRVGEELVVSYVGDQISPFVFGYRRTVRMEFRAMEGRRLVGRVGDRLLMIDTAAIRTVRRQIGTKPASAPAMVAGSAAGFAAGFVVGAMVRHRSRAWSQDPDPGMSPVNRGLATGVLVGAPLGAFAAWVVSRSRPIYEEVQIGRARPSVVMDLSGRVGLTVSVLAP